MNIVNQPLYLKNHCKFEDNFNFPVFIVAPHSEVGQVVSRGGVPGEGMSPGAGLLPGHLPHSQNRRGGWGSGGRQQTWGGGNSPEGGH